MSQRFLAVLTSVFVAVFMTSLESSLHGAPENESPAPAVTESGKQPGKSPSPAPSAQEISEWVAALDDDRYATRLEATHRLMEAGTAALEPIVAVAMNGGPEAATRALIILESLYRKSFDTIDPEADKIEQALERLTESPNQVTASRAADVLEWNFDVREERALANIRRLGGVLRYESDRDVNVPPAVARFGQMKSIILTADWKGGDDGLRFVKRLTGLRSIYRIPGGHVSDKGIHELQAALPDLQVEVRGPTYLGIKAQPELVNGEMKWRIDDVERGSSAESGGILVGDVVVRFAGKDVQDFAALIELIKLTKVDEELEVVVQRGGERKTLKLVMQGWKNLDDEKRGRRAK